MLQRLLVLIRASRVPGWFFGPILYTIGVIHSRVLPKTTLDILRSGFQLFCLSFPLCIIVFGVNDVYDYPSDIRNPRKHEQSLEGGILDPIYHDFVLSSARVASALILLSSFIPSQSSPRNFQQPTLTTFILFLSWQYSSPPLRLKERPILDSLSNGALVWLCWALGYTSSGSALFGASAGEGAEKGWLLAFCTAGVHALGAAADVEADIAAGQRTIATVFGERLAAGFSAALYLLASTTVEPTSFVGIYSFVGTVISLVPVFRPEWAHQTFKTIVYVSVIGATGWIGERALGILKSRKAG
ncbi:prenyltransferase [Fomitiporia mediterranea MF3/22]|uniref:prenyltransferase n=1 Tax=Fomitiporia mediterranea (strain MF3/22) TaxID=694068 RepID=UPI0004408600|nr:prenyltransferase [Fomitiporia mediterranea MF3/22]EJD07247.1 prenyltransferase [Fomitiporia mediterranea MF3/22]